MVDQSLFIKVRNTLLVLIAVLGGLFMIEGALYYLIKIELTTTVYNFLEYSAVLFGIVSVIIVFSLAVIYMLKYKESVKLRKAFSLGLLISIPLLIAGIIIALLMDNYLIISISAVFLFIAGPFTLYVFYDHRMSRINLFMLIGFVLSLIFKRLHFPFAGILLSFFCINIALGMIVYFYKCLFTIEKNKYLKLVSMFASLLIALGFLSVLFRFQHWPGAGLLIASFYSPMVILTIIVLLTLPGSGFISWKKSHREILTKKLLLLWIAMLLFGSLRFILPQQAFNTLFVKEIRQTSAFGMYDYDLEEKNGLVNETKK